MKHRIIHIASDSPIFKEFISTLDSFDSYDHSIISFDKNLRYLTKDQVNQINLKSIKDLYTLIKMINSSYKIIIHGFSEMKFMTLLLFYFKVLHKSYWIIWGSDLYVYKTDRTTIKEKIKHFIRKKVFSKVGHLVTYIQGDYELARKWYSAKGEYHECFMYPSNLYKEYYIKPKKHSAINIQIGNSSDPSNNHLQVLQKLLNYKDQDIKIYVPLSYGDQDHAKEVIQKGKEFFGDKFIPITEFMSFEEYIQFLSDIDIAIFNHNRQQAMGNIITLLGLGKKVYMRHNITPWKMFEDIGVNVFDVSNLDIDLLAENTKELNQQKVKEYFSKENYLRQLHKLFEG